MRPIVVAGPTGSGKSRLALRLAETLNGEIVNYDSVQIYRGFDIGSAKPSIAERAVVPHHLFDLIEATDDFTAAEYGRVARETLARITARGKRAIFVGGTFFYLRAFLQGLPEMPGADEALRARIRRIAARPLGPARLHAWLRRVDPESARRIAPADRHRVERALEVWIRSGRPISTWDRHTPSLDPVEASVVGLTMDRALLNRQLDARVDMMYAAGLVRETAMLLERYPAEARPFGSIGYREAVAHLTGSLTLADAIAETRRRTRAYAKRQMTWLRSERNLQWIDASDPAAAFAATIKTIEDPV